MTGVQRVVILGRGGSGKSTVARRLGEVTGLPVVELDTVFWDADLRPTPPEAWAAQQEQLAAGDRWILDGDLGARDVLDVRLARADTVVVLDLPVWRCAWRAWRRSPERADFWWWLVTWRWRSRPALMAAVHRSAPVAQIHVLRSQAAIDAFVARCSEGD